eukprot:scpid17339/ scgid24181/ 
MADLSSLDIPTLQNMMNDASTYDERAAIRKAIREQRAKSAPSKTETPASGPSYYRSGTSRAAASSTAASKKPANQYQFVGVRAAGTTSSALGERRVTGRQNAKDSTGKKS